MTKCSFCRKEIKGAAVPFEWAWLDRKDATPESELRIRIKEKLKTVKYYCSEDHLIKALKAAGRWEEHKQMSIDRSGQKKKTI